MKPKLNSKVINISGTTVGGIWIEAQCKKCGYTFNANGYEPCKILNYCPNCGAKMCGTENGTLEKIIDLDFNNQLDKRCGNCKHWHEHIGQKYHLKTGDCDKIIKGTKFSGDGQTYEYDGYSFEDECYDDYFNCFEGV